ncbi:trehalose-phosphatase [Mariniluteicoccus flavus]
MSSPDSRRDHDPYAALAATADGVAGVRALVDDPAHALIALDFDGVTAPIVDDPEQAYALPATIAVLGELGERVGTLAIITGRPVRTAVRLGGLDRAPGLGHLIVLGQYGVERWDGADDRYSEPEAPPEIDALRRELPDLLAEAGHAGLHIEDKGRALAVHTRRAPDPAAAYAAVVGPVTAAAQRLGLHLEPGRNVLEVRAAGLDKGHALEALVAERGVRAVAYAGDDLGDLPAFRAVDGLRGRGVPGVLIRSASPEQDALAPLADVEVEGPEGVAAWLGALAALLR